MEELKNEMSIEDLDILTYTDEDDLLRNLLFTWGLTKLYDEFFNTGVTLEDLRHINLDELKDLIPNERIGERFRLRRNLEKWRVQQGYEPFYFNSGHSPNDSQARTPQTHRRAIMTLATPPPPPKEQQKLLQELFNVRRATPEPNNLSMTDSQNREAIPLEHLLQSNPKGQSIIDYYREHKILDDLRKKLLVDCIVSHYSNLVQRMTSSDVDYYAESIIKLFPNEDKDYYYVPRVGRKNARGKLYDKAGNVAHRLRVTGLIKSKFIKRATVEATEVTSTNITEMSEAESESMTWLKHHIKPLSEVEHHWMITQDVRAKDMKYYTNPIALFAQWPHYKQTFGSGLVDLDFKFLYPDKEIVLFEKWGLFAEKALPYYRQHIKDKRTLHILSKLSDNTDPNSAHCMLVLAIHAILKPVRISIKVSESKSQICQYSILDSQGTFIIQGDCREEIEEKLEILRESTMMRSSPDILPLIGVVGEDYDELKEFYVVYDGVFYKFQTFLKALDICFKLYHVFNISYPKQCIVVWTFIQRYFYDIQRSDDEKNPNVCNFMSHLK